MGNKLAVSSFLGTVELLLKNCPENVRTLMFVVFFLVTVDTITGVIAAIACKQLRSSTMRMKLVMKMLQYALLMSLAFAATVASSVWWFFELSLVAIISIEAISFLENIVKFSKYSGVSLGPAQKTIDVLSQYFDAGQENTHTIVSTSTVIPPHPEKQPSITTTSIDKVSAGKDPPVSVTTERSTIGP